MARGRAHPLRLTAVPEPLEHATQRAICRTLGYEIAPPGRISADGVCWLAIDHAQIVPRSMQDRGVIPGIPDVLILWRGAHFWIEIKRYGPAAVLSPEQQALIPHLIGAGDKVGLVRDVGETLLLLDAWSIPRRRRVTVTA